MTNRWLMHTTWHIEDSTECYAQLGGTPPACNVEIQQVPPGWLLMFCIDS